jgi:hypothetical protein
MNFGPHSRNAHYSARVQTRLRQENSEPGETLARNEEKEKRICGGTCASFAYGLAFMKMTQ